MSPELEIIDAATQEFEPSHVFGLFSGGHDSLCACHIASQHPSFSGCVHINTGIGVEETRDFVRETCEQYGWPLNVYHPPDSYEEIVCEHGFPGPAQHQRMFIRLKERCIRQIMREHGHRSRKIMFISGARHSESTRRMVTCTKAVSVGPMPSKRAIWVSPIISWTSDDKKSHMRKHGLPENPVVKRLCMSGECLCGAFAESGELDVIRGFYPKAAAEIDRIAEKVKAAGKHCVWGERPSRPIDPNQMLLPLCTSCADKWIATEEPQ